MVDGLNCPPLIPETVDGKTNNANVFGKKNKPKPIAICNNSCQLIFPPLIIPQADIIIVKEAMALVALPCKKIMISHIALKAGLTSSSLHSMAKAKAEKQTTITAVNKKHLQYLLFHNETITILFLKGKKCSIQICLISCAV